MSEPEKIPLLEPAKSNRSTCKTCNQKIEKGEYRVGVPYDFTTPDGNKISSYRFHHPKCVPLNHINLVMQTIDKNLSIESEIKSKLISELETAKETKQAQMEKPFIEEAKSSRSSCRICEEKIEKGSYRVAEPSRVDLEDGRSFSSHKYYHINCYLDQPKNPKELFNQLTQVSLDRKIFTRSEISLLENKLTDILLSDTLSSDILSLISSDPIDLEVLKQKAQKIGVSETALMKNIERGLKKGIYFEPSLGKIQKL